MLSAPVAPHTQGTWGLPATAGFSLPGEAGGAGQGRCWAGEEQVLLLQPLLRAGGSI